MAGSAESVGAGHTPQTVDLRSATPRSTPKSSGMLNAARHAGTLTALPAREHDALALMAEGRSSGAIADQLMVTQATG